jgi:hypothetical protein
MTLSEFTLMLIYEAQKTFNFVHEVNKNQSPDIVNTHLAIEKFEISLPVSFEEIDVDVKIIERYIKDEKYKKLYYPFIPNNLSKSSMRNLKNIQKGKTINVEIKSTGKLPVKAGESERIGNIKITLTPVRS